MNTLDKLIGGINPEKGLSRAKARVELRKIEAMDKIIEKTTNKETNSGYSRHGASRVKRTFKNWFTDRGTPDEDITENLSLLRERSWDLFMSSPLATGAIKVKRTAVVGKGLRAKPSIDHELLGITQDEARTIELDIERKWKRWAESTSCDKGRRHNFYTLQRLLKLSLDMNGDVFWIPFYEKKVGSDYELSIQLIEGDRVSNPRSIISNRLWSLKDQFRKERIGKNTIVEGVELDENGSVVAYHIAKLNRIKNKTHERVEAFGKLTGERMIYHLFEPERIGQTRGVPILAPVMGALKDLTRYTDAEMKRSIIMSMFTAFITSQQEQKTNPLSIGNVDTSHLKKEEGKGEEPEKQESINLGSGNIVELQPGEDVKTSAPNSMNIGFEIFIKTICVQIGSALEIPHDILMKQFNDSYSASRAALMEFWRVASSERDYMVYNFCQPVYEKFILELVEKGKINLPRFFDSKEIRDAYTRCTWVGESKGHLDPVKEIVAAEKRVGLGISTLEKEAREIGNDWEEMHKQSVIERKKRAEDKLVGGGIDGDN